MAEWVDMPGRLETVTVRSHQGSRLANLLVVVDCWCTVVAVHMSRDRRVSGRQAVDMVMLHTVSHLWSVLRQDLVADAVVVAVSKTIAAEKNRNWVPPVVLEARLRTVKIVMPGAGVVAVGAVVVYSVGMASVEHIVERPVREVLRAIEAEETRQDMVVGTALPTDLAVACLVTPEGGTVLHHWAGHHPECSISVADRTVVAAVLHRTVVRRVQSPLALDARIALLNEPWTSQALTRSHDEL